ncbi:HPP family protein [Tepidicaulis sp. LMO-SS28]|uniref:HPP family protein n=1 Tax=Tepidicaulis sp. LMO-SS28 TaxID=3447455 RepID=UPI003EDED5F8
MALLRSLFSALQRLSALLLPDAPQLPGIERWRAFAGAFTGIFVTGLLSQFWLGVSSEGAAFLIAPMGASAVLLFAVPASPLAQPWSIMGGNILSALVGITAVKLIGHPVLASAVAVAAAIAAMSALRCLHPPGGAVALTAAMGGPDVFGAGYMFAVYPVAANSALLLLAALAFNNMTRHSYPHSAPVKKADPAPLAPAPLPVTHADIEEALADYGDWLDISAEDAERLFRDIEARALTRQAAAAPIPLRRAS